MFVTIFPPQKVKKKKKKKKKRKKRKEKKNALQIHCMLLLFYSWRNHAENFAEDLFSFINKGSIYYIKRVQSKLFSKGVD